MVELNVEAVPCEAVDGLEDEHNGVVVARSNNVVVARSNNDGNTDTSRRILPKVQHKRGNHTLRQLIRRFHSQSIG